MPGSSLWLIPPPDSPLYAVLDSLIKTHIPAIFHPTYAESSSDPTTTTTTTPAHAFYPHLTLTSNLPSDRPASTTPQAWLDALPLTQFNGRASAAAPHQPHNDENDVVTVHIGGPETRPPFFRKLALAAGRDEALWVLAFRARLAVLVEQESSAGGGGGGVGEGEGEGEDEAELRRKTQAKQWVRKEFAPHCSLIYSDIPEEVVQEKLKEVRKAIEEAKETAGRECTSAVGAEVWLVPTDKPIAEWHPIAKRTLERVEWLWGP